MKRLFCACLFILFHLASNAQDADSISVALAKASHDSVRVKILSYQSENAPDGIWEGYTVQLKELTEKKLTEENDARLKKFYAKYLAVALNNLALDESNKGNNDQAETYWEESQKMAHEAGDLSLEAIALSNVCRQYYNGGQLEKAFDGFHQALKIHRLLGDSSRIATSLNYLGDIYRTQKDLQNAAKSYAEALHMLLAVHDTVRLADVYNRLGMVATMKNDEEGAMTYYTNALSIYERKGMKRGAINIQFQLGKMKAKIGKMKESLPYYYRTLAMLKNTEQNYILMHCLSSMGQAYYFLGQLDSATHYFQQHILIDKDFKYPDILLETTKLSYKIQKQRGNMTMALGMHELFLRASDSIYNDASRKAVLKSQYKYEYDKKALLDSLKTETEKNVMEARLAQEKTQRYGLLGGIVLVLMTAGFGFSQYRAHQRLKELKLRNQIASDLHDEVGSAISSISLFAGMARMKRGENTEVLVEKIEETSRETINTMSDIVWSIEPANDNFQNVLRKMKQFGEQLTASLNIDFKFIVEPGIDKLSLDMKQRKNIYLVYKEAVNNSCKHAQPTAITVTLRKNSGAIVMTVLDNGLGFDVNQKSSGYGTGSMKARTADLNGNLAIISSAETGTSITLTVPL